ncbi:MAG: LexA family transcriptional regulator [Proteobacteria bacterium]|nr:LexA family transcriptional regulator [Pseudomonadota bacterium]
MMDSTRRLAFARRLKQVMNQQALSNDRPKLSALTLAKNCDVTFAAIYRWLKGETYPDMDNLARIAQIYEVSLDWLLLGESGSQLKFPSSGARTGLSCEFTLFPQGGKTSTHINALSTPVLGLNKHVLEQFLNHKTEHLRLFQVKGEAMTPTAYDSDVICYEPGSFGESGLYAVGIQDVIELRRIDMLGKRLRVSADNPLYPPAMMKAQDLHLLGKALWKIGRI